MLADDPTFTTYSTNAESSGLRLTATPFGWLLLLDNKPLAFGSWQISKRLTPNPSTE